MFGLEEQKRKKKSEEFVFDLERDLASKQSVKEMSEKLQARMQKIKETLRSGDSKEEFDQLGAVLLGYSSIEKVLSRIKAK